MLLPDPEQQKYHEWLATVETHGVNLTSWEEDFVASLRDQVNHGRRLSERQGETLEQIYAEKTP